jgi:hypothetical protein
MPLGQSCAAIASVALSTNTTARLPSPSTSTAIAVHDTAQIGIRGSIEARPVFFESHDRVIPLFRVSTRKVILRAVGDRLSDGTLQVQLW